MPCAPARLGSTGVCGIAGIWLRSGRPVAPELLERMGDVLRHRGPDGDGRHLDGGIGLVHRRLAIVDPTEASAQPMSTPDGSLWLNYNGEIHNYVELRRELATRGVRFRSDGDTEVVLWAYRIWGDACFERFNGMWAAAFWEPRARRLVLSRDRFGIKPLVWSERGERVAFASEPKAILAAFPDEREPDEREVHAFLSGAYPDGTEATFFRNVRSVLAGETLTFEDGRRRPVKYWSFTPGREEPRRDAADLFRHLLEDSVRLRMRSDVSVGACVSGGLDSTSVVRLASPHAGGPMHCFCLAYDDPRFDESAYSRLAADDPARFLVHWVRPGSDRMMDTIERIVWHHDAPTPIRGRYPHWFVMREAGRHVKVVLDGQGSDEMLAGYVEFVMPWLLDRILPRQASAAQRARAVLQLPGALRELADLARVDVKPSTFPLRMLRPFLRRADRRRRRRSALLHPDFREAFPPPPGTRVGHPWARRDVLLPYGSRLNNALWQQLRTAGLPEVLHSEDALSMAFSIESRTPFLDHRLVELCFSLPFDEKIRDGWTKSLLRRAFPDVLPPAIRMRRRKLGFPAPVARWLGEPANLAALRDVLLDGSLARHGIVAREPLAAALSGTDAPRFVRSRVNVLWRLMTLGLWYDLFVHGPREAANSSGRSAS